MSYAQFIRRSISLILIIAAIIGISLLIVRVYPILILGLLSWIIAVGLGIPINFFRRKGMRRGSAIIVTFILTAIVIALFIRLVLPALVAQVNNLIAELPQAGESAVTSYIDLRASSETLSGILPEFTVEDYRSLLDTSTGGVNFDLASIATSALPLIANVGGFLVDFALNLFLIFFLTLYFTLDPLIYYRIIIAFTPPEFEARALDVLEKVRKTIIVWVGSMVLEITITAVMVTVALGLVLRLPNAVALGVLAGIGNIVPYVGYWAALIPIIIIAAAVGGPSTAVLAFIFYFVIGIIEANIILPANIGSSLKVPAAVILLFQGIAGTVLGFWGVLLAMPILAIITTLLRELVVYDALGKRGRIPHIVETPDGELVLAANLPEPPDMPDVTTPEKDVEV